ncbi:MAG: hypothetical protein HUJ61_07690 [Bacilli bacterium]|nr:hypothetical protein [Bacilli bacterium]
MKKYLKYVMAASTVMGAVMMTSCGKHEHEYDAGVVTKAATCTEDGVKTFTCKCGDNYTETITKLGHDLKKVEAVAATFTAYGNNEYYKCSHDESHLFKDAEGTKPTTLEEEKAGIDHAIRVAPGESKKLTTDVNAAPDVESYSAVVLADGDLEINASIRAKMFTWPEDTDEGGSYLYSDHGKSYAIALRAGSLYSGAAADAAKDVNVVIKGGVFEQDVTEAEVATLMNNGTGDRGELIYAAKGAHITIEGGSFKSINPALTLNAQDKKASIVVKGGRFYKYDPSDLDSHEGQPSEKDGNGNYLYPEVVVAEGYKVVANGDWFEVVPDEAK